MLASGAGGFRDNKFIIYTIEQIFRLLVSAFTYLINRSRTPVFPLFHIFCRSLLRKTDSKCIFRINKTQTEGT